MKWYDNILSTLRTWFGNEEATEAEIHAEMEAAGGLDGLRAKIRSEVTAEKQTEIDTLTSKYDEMKNDSVAQENKLTKANEELTAAKSYIAELEKRSTALITKVKSEGSEEGADDEPSPVWKAYQAHINSL